MITNMMPIDEYRKSLQILQQIFRLTFQNVFERNYRYNVGFYLTVISWLFGITCQISTVLDYTRFNPALRLSGFGLMHAALQVRSRFTDKVNKNKCNPKTRPSKRKYFSVYFWLALAYHSLSWTCNLWPLCLKFR